MAEFTLPPEFVHNCELIQDPTAYAKAAGAASWLFLVGDEFASMPNGISYAQVQAAVPHSARVISDPPRELTVELAREQIAALDALPRPVLVSCRSGPRASAAVYLYAGLKAGATFEEVVAAAERAHAPFCGNEAYRQWVKTCLAALRESTSDASATDRPMAAN